jgi:hypothetical protein
MDIFFTFDYELFFGNKSGSAEKCLLEPANELRRIAEKSNASFTFFVDAGYLVKLDEYRKKIPSLEKDFSAVSKQLETLFKSGHDLQLHIHSHWQDSFYDGEKWVINTKRYKLADFSDAEANDIFESYYNELKKYCPSPIAFRAGGWCIQPFEKFKPSFKKFGIAYDSSVYKGGSRFSEQYNFDFRNAPEKTSWQFEDDPLKEKSDGSFTEIAMNARTYSPLFFWKLFLLGRMNPEYHKYIGDGTALSVPGYRRKILTQSTLQCTNSDGYYASEIESDLHKAVSRKTGNEFVILGHPKAMTKYSLRKLEELIPKLQKNNSIHSFTSYHYQKPENDFLHRK